MANLKKMIGIASVIAIPAAAAWLAGKVAERKIETETEVEPNSETEIESENNNESYMGTDKSAMLVTTEHKWWTRDPEGELKLHSLKVGTIGTLSQTDLDEFRNTLERGTRAEDIATTAVAMLIEKGYKVASLRTYDSK
jgi:H+/gluconate symporter-like permease